MGIRSVKREGIGLARYFADAPIAKHNEALMVATYNWSIHIKPRSMKLGQRLRLLTRVVSTMFLGQ